MINKYRVHEVAKDFDVKSTVIVDLLLQYFPDTKKHMTVLEEEELDIIFDTFTTEHAVENFDAYFATAELPRPERKHTPKPVEPAKEEAKPAAAAVPAAKKPEQGTKDRVPAQGAQPAAGAQKPPQPFQGRAPLPPKPRVKDPARPTQSRTKGETQTVDTRAGNVELDKYNERYEQIAPVNKSPRAIQHSTNKNSNKNHCSTAEKAACVPHAGRRKQSASTGLRRNAPKNRRWLLPYPKRLWSRTLRH